LGLIVRAVTRRNIFAIIVGAVLAGAPFIAFNLWLDNLIERQGETEVGTAAKRAIALAEARVRDAVGTLDSLALGGVASCDEHVIEAMRYAAFNTVPVKEIAVIGPDGKTLCNHLGLPPGERNLISSEPLSGVRGYHFDIISLPNGKHMVRLPPRCGHRVEQHQRFGANGAFLAAGIDTGRTVQRLRTYCDCARRHDRRIRPVARR
jgi:hypothetical protein